MRLVIGRGPRRAPLIAGVCMLGLLAAACVPTSSPPATGTAACASSGASAAPVSVYEAGEAAADAVREAGSDPDRRDERGEIPLVVVEEGKDGSPVVDVVPVSDEREAREVAERAAAEGDVVAVEVDEPAHASLVDYPPDDPFFVGGKQWGMKKTTFGPAWSAATGAGVTVAVLDTGVQRAHPDLKANVLAPGKSYYSVKATSDANGHGTHVAGILGALTDNSVGIASAAPEVMILPVKVLNDSGRGFASDVSAGIIWAVNHGADVINTSLGIRSPTKSLTRAVEHARDNGVPIVAAAGNTGGSTCQWPAVYPATIAVGAVQASLTRAPFSSTGSFLDVVAPGVNICSTVSIRKNFVVASPYRCAPSVHEGYAKFSGTSMATAFVSGAVALLKEQCPALSSNTYRNKVRASADDLGPAGKDNQYGYGLVDPAAALQITAC